MDPQAAASTTAGSPPSLDGTEAKRRVSDEGLNAAPEELRHASDQPLRLEDIREGGTVHKCRECMKVFQLPSRLMAHGIFKHRKKASLLKHPACPVCDKKCKSRAIMALHLGTHIGERQCKKCGAQFASARSAVVHRRFHLTGGNFQCDICGKLFPRKCQRNEHCFWEHGQVHQPATSDYSFSE
ncbi:zinc finger protein 711-like [Amblyomma americanum]